MYKVSLEQLEPETMGAETHRLPRAQTWDKGTREAARWLWVTTTQRREAGKEGGGDPEW